MQETKQCQNCQREFTVEPEDFKFYEKISDKNSEVKVPAPTWCPECRAKRRMNFYNAKTLYKRKCDKCGKSIFSIYSENNGFTVWCNDCWWADNWDSGEYQQDYDFSKSFWDQFSVLQKRVPRPASETEHLQIVNSPYVNACGNAKNCYLVFVADHVEDSRYCYSVSALKNVADCLNIEQAENSYNLVYCAKIYGSTFSSYCDNCVDVHFSKKLKNCNNCFGCVNLKNKSYCIFNKQYTKKEYEKQLEQFDLGSYKTQKLILKEVKKIFLTFPVKYLNGFKNENVSGDNIWFSKNVKQSYSISDGENIKYSQMLETPASKDCYDYTDWGQNAELMYEVGHAGENVNNIKFTNNAWQTYNVECTDTAFFSDNLFGCVFVRKKSYCILNKQYTKEEYFPMVEKIKKQMNEMPYVDKQGMEYKYGEFFPPELSPFAYNETITQEYFPLTKEEAKKQGYKWRDPEKRTYQTTIKAKDLPDNIKEVDDSILKEVIGCATKKEDRESTGCTTAFKIIPQELEFYKKMNLPLPRYCPNCRHHQRLKNRNPLKLYKRTCQKEGCNTEFETTYAPDRPEIVYCEKCYQNEII